MKRQLSPLLLILMMVFCAGCDGHIRTLHFVKPSDQKPSWSVSSTTVEVQGNEDIPGIVSQVATQLKMKEESTNRWYTETKDKSTFTLVLKKSEQNFWTANLIDFPSVNRSDESRIAEDRIRSLLKKAQQGR